MTTCISFQPPRNRLPQILKTTPIYYPNSVGPKSRQTQPGGSLLWVSPDRSQGVRRLGSYLEALERNLLLSSFEFGRIQILAVVELRSLCSDCGLGVIFNFWRPFTVPYTGLLTGPPTASRRGQDPSCGVSLTLTPLISITVSSQRKLFAFIWFYMMRLGPLR